MVLVDYNLFLFHSIMFLYKNFTEVGLNSKLTFYFLLKLLLKCNFTLPFSLLLVPYRYLKHKECAKPKGTSKLLYCRPLSIEHKTWFVMFIFSDKEKITHFRLPTVSLRVSSYVIDFATDCK